MPQRELLPIVALVAVVAALVGGAVGIAVAMAADGGMPRTGADGMGSMMDGYRGMGGGRGKMSEADFERMHDLCHRMMEGDRSEGTS